MSRPWHYLKPSRHAGYPKQQIALSAQWERRPRQREPGIADDVLMRWEACAWTGPPGEESALAGAQGTDALSFWLWLRGRVRRKQQVWIWCYGMAHALSLLGFWRMLTDGEWLLSREDCDAQRGDDEEVARRYAGCCIVEDPPTIIVGSEPHRSGSVRYLDVRNLGVGEGSNSELASGCAVRLALWLQQWSRCVEELNLGGLRQTAAAQAWHGWRYSYLEDGVLVHDNEQATGLERDSIHPGRAEAYRLGRTAGPVHQLDAAAHYPSCAIAGGLPVRLRWCGQCDLTRCLAAIDRGYLAIARCRVRCPIPLLPYRQRDRTIWPVGEWTVTLPGPELRRAMDTGCCVSIDEAALYEPGLPLTAFVRSLFSRREQARARGETGTASAVKLILNALVGKLASRAKAWVDAPEGLPPAPWSTWQRVEGRERRIVRYRSIAWHVQRLEEGGETAESTPALASWIYSTGRMRLWDWMEAAGREDVYYVDSDSLFCSKSGHRRLAGLQMVSPGTLGALRLQGMHPSIRIAGIRDYTASGKTVRAGTSQADAVETCGHDHWWRESTVRESVGEHRMPDASARLVVVPVHRAYRHGVVDGNGRVSPLRVEE